MRFQLTSTLKDGEPFVMTLGPKALFKQLTYFCDMAIGQVISIERVK